MKSSILDSVVFYWHQSVIRCMQRIKSLVSGTYCLILIFWWICANLFAKLRWMVICDIKIVDDA